MKRYLAIATMCILSTAAFAAPQGFNNAPVNTQVQGFNGAPLQERTLQDIIQNAYDDEFVATRGRLTKQLNKDLYEFVGTDNNRIAVELDDDMPWTHIKKDQLILIEGEVDRDAHGVTIDVKRATPLTK